MTLESGRLEDKSAQACGFVSSTIVRSEGGTPARSVRRLQNRSI